MAVALDHFLETRAIQLAVVHLTRRSDVQVTQEARVQMPQESRVRYADLMVSLLENGQDVGQLLAVEVKAAATDNDILKASRSFDKQSSFVSYFPFPMCLFVFSMETDKGVWRWVRRPQPDALDKSHLWSVSDDKLSPLTNEAMSQMLNTVRDWYQQRQALSR